MNVARLLIYILLYIYCMHMILYLNALQRYAGTPPFAAKFLRLEATEIAQ